MLGDAGIALSVSGASALSNGLGASAGRANRNGKFGLALKRCIYGNGCGGCSRSSDTLLLPGFNKLETDQAEHGLYPNPSPRKSLIKGDQGPAFVLMDAQGRECLSGVLGAEADLDLQGLAPGWYGLRVGERMG